MGNNGAMQFNAYPELYRPKHAHSLLVYFPHNQGTGTALTGAIAHDIRTSFS